VIGGQGCHAAAHAASRGERNCALRAAHPADLSLRSHSKPLVFTRFLQDPLKISNQGEIGFSLGSASRLDLPVVGNPRIGVGYVFGGGLSVLRASFGFPF